MTRIAVAGFQHETNTFAPFPTTLRQFQTGGAWPALTRGDAIRDVFADLNIPVSGFLRACRHDIAPILWAGAEPGGYVEQAAFDTITAEITKGIAKAAPDAVYLDLHGAMVTRDHPDAEAEILRRVRDTVGPDLPIAVSLDLHGNLSRAFFDLATIVTIYRTYPHVDMADTGARAAALLDHALQHGAPAKAFRQGDFLIPITAQSTEFAPGRDLYAHVAQADAVSADMALGFPPADIPDLGPSIFAYGTSQAQADAAADAILADLRRAAPDFDPRLLAPEAAIAQARAHPGPTIIADVQDNPGAGGTGDTTGLLRALNAGAVPDAILGLLYDPDSARAAHAAGLGATPTLPLGGAFDQFSAPLEAHVTVEALHDGPFLLTGPFYSNTHADLGPMARLHLVGTGIRVAVASRRAQNADQQMFRILGLDPSSHAIICVKSAIHFMADYKRISDHILFAESPGANPCNLGAIPYQNLRPGLRTGPEVAPKT